MSAPDPKRTPAPEAQLLAQHPYLAMLDPGQGSRSQIEMLIPFVLRGALECGLEVMEAQMRRLTGTILLMGMMLSTSAIQAQTYDPRYPVCVQLATTDGTSIG